MPNIIYQRFQKQSGSIGGPKLQLHLERSDCVVSGKVLAMDEMLRGKGVLVRVEEDSPRIITRITSNGRPELRDDVLYVRGSVIDRDDDTFAYTYASEREAIQAFDEIHELVGRINRGDHV